MTEVSRRSFLGSLAAALAASQLPAAAAVVEPVVEVGRVAVTGLPGEFELQAFVDGAWRSLGRLTWLSVSGGDAVVDHVEFASAGEVRRYKGARDPGRVSVELEGFSEFGDLLMELPLSVPLRTVIDRSLCEFSAAICSHRKVCGGGLDALVRSEFDFMVDSEVRMALLS